ncbi:hypothetical protein [Blastopirellula marina]|uniref:Uncharacterized protein n=1 Tax=Blastopirellula marina TaxID=124 RepID=A0A2S8G9C8_9BACT|nr:hypothetical protein [Blastopirellula marina]PQO41033.1 hypothetical protein C5Y98_03460 [Blastopirellula marina]PTL45909.1 hypothetical protein C5Y97_03460 [Blastopirellula marina]
MDEARRKENLVYHKALGIPLQDCPPNHYQFLGIDPAETDAAIIRQAAIQRLQQIKSGDLGEIGEALDRRIRKVAKIILDPNLRAKYDQQLQSNAKSAAPSAGVTGSSPPNVSPPPETPESDHTPVSQAPISQAPDPAAAPTAVAQVETATSQVPPTNLKVQRAATATQDAADATPQKFAIKSPMIWGAVALVLLLNVGILAYLFTLIPGESEVAQADAASPTSEADDTQTENGNKLYSETSAETSDGSDEPANPELEDEGDASTEEALGGEVVQTAGNLTEKEMGGAAPIPVTKPDEPKLEEDASKPFERLNSEVDLPQISDATALQTEAITLGVISSTAVDSLRLEIDSGAADLEANHRFRIEPLQEEGKPIERWSVKVEGADGTGTDRSVAHFFVDNIRRLRFHWGVGVTFAIADQLRNSILTCTCDTGRHAIMLRTPGRVAGMPLILDDRKLEEEIPISTWPLEENLFFELTAIKNFGSSVTVEPETRKAKLGENIVIYVGPPNSAARGEIIVSCRKGKDGKVEFSVKPKYRLGDNKKVAELTAPSVSVAIGKLHRLLASMADEYAGAHAAYPGLLAQMNALNRKKPGSLQEAGAISRARVQTQGLIDKAEGVIKRASKQLPESYAALNQLIEAAHLGKRLHGEAEIEYQVGATTQEGELPLVFGNSQPPPIDKASGFDFVAQDAPAVGFWMILEPFHVVQLAPGGDLRVFDITGKNVVGKGTWKKERGQIKFSSERGLQESYTMKNGFALVSQSGKILYRKFNR